jgi:hypothetical protein
VQLRTAEQAQNFVLELVQEMVLARARCTDVQGDESVQYARRAFWVFLEKHGQVLGAAKALFAAGLLSENLYREVLQRAANALGSPG